MAVELKVKGLSKISGNKYSLNTENYDNWTIFQDRTNTRLFFSFAGRYGDYGNINYYYYVIDKQDNKNHMYYQTIVSTSKQDREQQVNNMIIEIRKSARDKYGDIR